MNDKKITLTYIAKKANVSVATVSRVLNGNSSVDEKIKNKINKIINSDGYNIKKTIKNKQIISVIIPDITNPFFANIIEGIENTANLYGYHIILSQYKENKDILNKYFRDITKIGVSGYIIVSSTGSSEYFNEILTKVSVPIIFLDRKVDIENINYVGSDNEIGAYNATKYLIDLGHKNIIYMAGPQDISTENERFSGFIKALNDNNIDFNYSKYKKVANFNFEESYIQMKDIIKSKLDYTAIFSACDVMCFGIKKATEEYGISIPNDISLIGYDNIPFSSMIGLTTVSSQAYEMGKNAVLSVLNIISERITDNINIVLQPNIVIRNSCKKI
ncbi:LacI family transcriptional regulator [Brachyspira pilosicoli WesB]|uniref:LacI family transcriptional regulator n=2 Tax=Brachyspira pilosicoli TaxID=52584 RepID=K0JHU0_BRAPL|nr:LacI family DNA-binding transcriptional regulator [Brachyspira pilosicoli]PLV64222.1 LacI family transcription regulator [Brachyspira pilosicoli SP16]WIH80492.1 LacI family DNA-binding transcriptional regulator [Brachyspira pilosicoli]WIH84932.1 LacI family DNA-binding transcriptional regulator [Brachyspira pilosicoli]WIH87187.1 LacI family DNA-binding transcriptional regulator [Brachyspira pilosicoli]WIH89465.1 LacI family DNA-binding transcriptional regulator [Brachyspira pilosicoli]